MPLVNLGRVALNAEAQEVSFDHTNTVITGSDVQEALEQLDSRIVDLNTQISSVTGSGGPVEPYDGSYGDITDTTTIEEQTEWLLHWMFDKIFQDTSNLGSVFTFDASNPADSTFVVDGVTHTGSEIFNGTWTQDLASGMKYELVNTPNTNPPIFTFVRTGNATVGVATDTVMGVIKSYQQSSTERGAVKVDPLTGLALVDIPEPLPALRVFYVNASTGDDANDGFTAGSAKKTLNFLVENGGIGYIYREISVVLAAGAYSLDTSNPTNCNGVVFIGAGTSSTTLNFPRAFSLASVYVGFSSMTAVFQQLFSRPSITMVLLNGDYTLPQNLSFETFATNVSGTNPVTLRSLNNQGPIFANCASVQLSYTNLVNAALFAPNNSRSSAVVNVNNCTGRLFVGDANHLLTSGYVIANGKIAVTEAPKDGKSYARKDEAWSEIIAGGSVVLPDSEELDAFHFYWSPRVGGDDSNDGLTASTPVWSPTRLGEIVRSKCAYGSNVNVHIMEDPENDTFFDICIASTTYGATLPNNRYRFYLAKNKNYQIAHIDLENADVYFIPEGGQSNDLDVSVKLIGNEVFVKNSNVKFQVSAEMGSFYAHNSIVEVAGMPLTYVNNPYVFHFTNGEVRNCMLNLRYVDTELFTDFSNSFVYGIPIDNQLYKIKLGSTGTTMRNSFFYLMGNSEIYAKSIENCTFEIMGGDALKPVNVVANTNVRNCDFDVRTCKLIFQDNAKIFGTLFDVRNQVARLECVNNVSLDNCQIRNDLSGSTNAATESNPNLKFVNLKMSGTSLIQKGQATYPAWTVISGSCFVKDCTFNRSYSHVTNGSGNPVTVQTFSTSADLSVQTVTTEVNAGL